MELTSGFVHSEAGLIPTDWRVVPLGAEVERLIAGVSVNSVDEGFGSFAHEHRVLKTSAVWRGSFLPEESKQVAPRDLDRVKTSVRRDTILISRMNTPELVGETAYVQEDNQNLYLPDRLWMTIVRKNSGLNVRWLAYLLNSDAYRTRIKGLATGTSGSMKNISKEALLRLPIPYPAPGEQRAVVRALGDVDALLVALDELIAKKRALKQAAMQDLLTGKRRLPGFSDKCWIQRKFGSIARPRSERTSPQLLGENVFCVELEDIARGSGRLVRERVGSGGSSIKAMFQAGDVLFGKLRAYLRKYWHASRPGICSTEIWVLANEPKIVTSEFLFQLVQQDTFIEAASTAYGTHMPRSDWSIVRNVVVDLPSIPEQVAIAAALSDMDAELEALEARLEKTRLLKQGMMQELLTGRIRLS
jgi:type I restriction enzyme, S subunit